MSDLDAFLILSVDPLIHSIFKDKTGVPRLLRRGIVSILKRYQE